MVRILLGRIVHPFFHPVSICKEKHDNMFELLPETLYFDVYNYAYMNVHYNYHATKSEFKCICDCRYYLANSNSAVKHLNARYSAILYGRPTKSGIQEEQT